jgi:hypothetical protein
MLATLLAWINSNPAVVSAIAASVSAVTAIMVMLATLTTVGLNLRLARENRELRKAESSPRVVAYLALNPRAYGAIDFVLRNIGKGPACNISYKIVGGGDDLNFKDVQLLPANLKYQLLPQNDELCSSMGFGWDLLEDPELSPFEVEVSYEDLSKRKYSGRFKLDVSQFDGMRRLGQPTDEKIAESLGKILGVMESWSHRKLQVETMSAKERREHEKALIEMANRRRIKQDTAKSIPD